MTNEIGIVWTSDQRQYMADMAKRQIALQKEIDLLKQVAKAGTDAGRSSNAQYGPTRQDFQSSLRERDAQIAFFRKRKEYWDQEEAARKKGADKAAQDAAHERDAQAAFYRQRKEFWAQDEVNRRKAAEKAAKDASDQRKDAAEFYRKRKEFWEAQEKAKQKEVEDIRRSLLTERQLALVNFRERVAQLERLRAGGALTNKEYAAGVAKAREEMEKVGRVDLWTPFQQALGPAAALLTTAGAIGAAIRLARAEFENLKSMQQDAAGANRTYAEAQAEAVKNLGAGMTAKELDAGVMAIAQRKHMSPAFVMNVASGMLGARGDATPQQVLENIESTIGFNRFNQQAATFTGSAVLMGQAANPQATAKAVFGQQMSGKIASPVNTDQDFAHYVVPHVIGGKFFGDTEKEGYGLAAYLATQMGDTTGRVSGTAMTDLRRDLKTHQFLQDVKVGEGTGTVDRLKAVAFDKKYEAVKKTLLGELHAKSQDELVKSGGKLTTEARAYAAIAQLIGGDKAAWDSLNAKRGEVTGLGPDAEKLVDTKAADLAGLPAQQTAAAEQGAAAESELSLLRNQGAARGHVSREALQKILKANGYSKVGQVLSGIQFEIGSDGGRSVPVETARNILSGLASQERGDHRIDSNHGGWIAPDRWMKQLFESMGLGSAPMRKANEQEIKAAESLERAAELLEQIASQPPNVVVNMPEQGKPGPPAAAGLQDPGGR